MFGMGLNKVFRNRWSALWWAAGMLFTAWQLVPAADPDDPPAASPASPRPAAANPWSK